MTKPSKTSLTPRLRFPEFREAGEWDESPVGDLVSTVSPPTKLKTSEYGDDGQFPIVDQSPDDYCGWTDVESALVQEFLPLIVFGDHTCVLKLIARPFVQGADGIKIIRPIRNVTTEYLFQFLNARPLQMESYKRHFSTLKQRRVFYPKLDSGEQAKIAACLGSLDNLIAAEGRKLAALRDHKQGLMQQLFPQPGQSQPRLRYPEFRHMGEWVNRKVSKLLKKVAEPVNVEPAEIYREIGIRSHGKGVFHKESITGKELGNKRVFWIVENAIILNIVFAWELAVANTTNQEKGMIASHRFPMYLPYKNKADVQYMKYFFLTHKGKELLWIASPGGAGRNKTLGQKDFENLELLLPERLEEQQKIADCLSALDARIASQAAKIDALQTHKRGLMQQIFPAPEKN